MNRTAHEVQTRWLESRRPEDRTGNEAEKFSDECWKNGLRLDKIPSVHYQLLGRDLHRSLTIKSTTFPIETLNV